MPKHKLKICEFGRIMPRSIVCKYTSLDDDSSTWVLNGSTSPIWFE